MKKYCAAPWRGMHINPTGDIKTCCAGDPNIIGNLHNMSLTDALESDVLNEIRSTIQQGKLHEKYCYNCIQAERYGVSERNWHNSVNDNFNPTLDNEYYPVLVDLRWNTTCNLSCNYCGDKCSSRWAALNNTVVKSGIKPYYSAVVDFLNQNQQHIREVALVGGEPLLLPENEKLISTLPNDITFTVITNASVELVTNRIFAELSKKPNVGWSLSLDNVGPKFEYVRYGANWDIVVSNINQIKDLFVRGHWGGIHAVYNLYNATCLTELIDWTKSNQLDIHWQSLYQPSCLDPLKHKKEIQNLCVKEIHTVLDRTDLTEHERDFLSQVLHNFINNNTLSDATSDLIAHTNKIEQHHPDKKGQFNQLWPEISKYL